MMPFPFDPPTPEQIAAAEKLRAERDISRARKISAAIPHLRAAQLELREAAALGIGCEHHRKAQEHIAILIEECETDLVRNT